LKKTEAIQSVSTSLFTCSSSKTESFCCARVQAFVKILLTKNLNESILKHWTIVLVGVSFNIILIRFKKLMLRVLDHAPEVVKIDVLGSIWLKGLSLFQLQYI